MKVVLVSPAWRRHEVTRVALAQRRHLCGELAGRGHEATCVVVCDDENADVAEEHGFHVVEQANEPLGRKFNDGIEHACLQLDADYVVPIGSDDWMHVSLFDRLPDGAVDTPEIVTGWRLAAVNMQTGRLQRVSVKGRSGTSPWIIPRSALRRSNYRPVGNKQIRGIDYSLLRGLGHVRQVQSDPHDLARVDFKSDVNLNSYADVIGTRAVGAEEDAWEALAELYPDELVDLARDTSDAMRGVPA